MSDSAVESPPQVRMTRTEFRATAYLAGVSGLRMLGLFIVLPVLALYAASLPGGGDPILQVDTYPLTIYSAAAIQELNRKVEQKETEITELKSRLEKLERLVSRRNRGSK